MYLIHFKNIKIKNVIEFWRQNSNDLRDYVKIHFFGTVCMSHENLRTMLTRLLEFFFTMELYLNFINEMKTYWWSHFRLAK